MRRNATAGPMTGIVGCTALVLTMITVTTGSAASAAPQRGCDPTWQQVAVPYSNYQTPLYFTTADQVPPTELAVSALSGSDARLAAKHGTQEQVLQQWNGRTIDRAQQQLPIPPEFRHDIAAGAQSFSSPDEGWLVANTNDRGSHSGQNRVVTYHWHDGRWTMVPTDVSSDPVRQGLSVQDAVSVSPDDAWLVGWRHFADRAPIGAWPSGVHIQRWDGTRWSAVDNPLASVPNAELRSVTAISANDVWAVGVQPDGLGTSIPLVMHWDGAEWRIVDTPTGNTPASLYGVSGTGPNDIWAVGAQTMPGTGNVAVPLTMHWNGSNWQVLDVPDVGNSRFHAVYAASPTDVWAVGMFPLGADAWFLHWDGQSWQRVRPPDAVTGVETVETYYDVHGSGPNDVWAVGQHTHRGQRAEDRPLVAHLSCGRNR